MFLAPINFYTSLSLVPIFKWEPVEVDSTEVEAPPPPPVAPEAGDSTPPKDAQETLREMRLVFKGFAWTPGVHIEDWREASFMSGWASVTPESSAPKSDKQDEEEARARKAALAAQRRTDANARFDDRMIAPDSSEAE